MKIAWITPFSERSAIGRVSSNITSALATKGHEVMIVRSERERDDSVPSHPTSLSVAWWHDVSPRDIESASDVIVVNFGDNYYLHAGTLAFVNTVPCIGVFHDYYLYNFFNRWVVLNGLGEHIHEREVRLTYGESAGALATKAWNNDVAVERIAQVFPMTEWLARRCGAALAHSHFYLHRLENSCPGPIAIAPLCFEGRNVKPLPSRGEDKVTITTIGVINPNKCADSVIKSIASSATLRSRCRFRLVGRISDAERARLQGLCGDLRFDHLDIVGEVDDATLVRELEGADIVSCLRKPVLEGASASAIEGMKAGRPVVVADAGFYAELPSDLVFKVLPSVEVSSLTEVLERLVMDDRLRREAGARARDWATRTFVTERYVDVLEKLTEQFVRAKPLLAVAERIGQQLATLEVTDDNPAVCRLANKMHDLFG
jgi:glycosyltransferase involved in cell wall biosynthesis